MQFHHLDEDIAGKDTALDIFALSFADFHFAFDGHDDTENAVLQAHRIDALFETFFNFVLVARITMDDIPDTFEWLARRLLQPAATTSASAARRSASATASVSASSSSIRFRVLSARQVHARPTEFPFRRRIAVRAAASRAAATLPLQANPSPYRPS